MADLAEVKSGPWHVEPDANGRDGFFSVWWQDDAKGIGCEIAGRIGEREFAELMAAAPDMKQAIEDALAEAEQALQSDAERPADLLEECDVRLNAIRDILQEVNDIGPSSYILQL